MRFNFTSIAAILLVMFSSTSRAAIPIPFKKNYEVRKVSLSSVSVKDTVPLNYTFSNIFPLTTAYIVFEMGPWITEPIDHHQYSSPVITGSSDFTIINDGCAGHTVYPGNKCQFTVAFTPTTDNVSVGTIEYTFYTYWYDENGVLQHDNGQPATFNGTGSRLEPCPECERGAAGSIIRDDSRTLGEAIQIVGVPFDLMYTSEFTSSYTSNRGYFSVPTGYNREGWVPSIWHAYNFDQGRLYLGSGRSQKVKYEVVSGNNAVVVSPARDEVYIFDEKGKHLSTKTFLTGSTKYTFNYNTSGYLTSITDANGNSTTFTRDSGGSISKITGPYGQETTTTRDSNGRLLSVVNPNSETYSFTYVSGTGLLSTFTKPGGQVSTFTYDSNGKLVKDLGYGDDFWEFLDVTGGYKRTSYMGRDTVYSGYFDVDGQYIRTVTLPTGETISSTEMVNSGGYHEQDGSETTNTYKNSDPRFSNAMKPHATYRYIGSNIKGTMFGESVSYSTGVTPGFFNFATLTKTVTNAGNVLTSIFDAALKTWTTTSQEGVTQVTVLNSKEQPTSVQIGSDTATSFVYDSNGRLSSQAQGSNNSFSYAYNSNGLLSSITNGRSEVTSFGYDLSGRRTSITLPDSRVVGFTYDANGNLKSVTPPSRPAHGFDYNAYELPSKYKPPTLSGVSVVNTTYSYDYDRALTKITRPTGAKVNYEYDETTGRLFATDISDGGVRVFTYNEYSDLLYEADSEDSVLSRFSYFGKMLQDEEIHESSDFSFIGKISWSYDSQYRVASRTIQDSTATDVGAISYTYNGDDKPTQIGSMSLTYGYPSGRLSTTSLSRVSDARSYDSYGNLSGYSAYYTPSGGTAQLLYSYTLTRDSMSRISAKTETIGGVTSTYSYSYDSAGRLTSVLKDSNPYSSYTCDSNSNRTGGTIAGTSFTATYDNQDRMLTFNSNAYAYNANGDLTQIDYSDATSATYNFDALGNLKAVTTRDGDEVGYRADGYSRTSSRTMFGDTDNRYIWENDVRLAATLDDAGDLEKEYIYGTSVNSPDYMVRFGSVHKIIRDHLGSVRLVVKVSDGSIRQRIDYNEFGGVISDSSPGYQDFGFAGGIYDKRTKLVKFGARYYDSEVGRWLTKDPILFNGGDTNLYGYVVNDPINLVDPSGLDGESSGSQTLQQSTVFVSPNGQSHLAVPGSSVRTSNNNAGLVIDPPGSQCAAGRVRLMDAGKSGMSPNGYGTMQNAGGQYMNAVGEVVPANSAEAHIQPTYRPQEGFGRGTGGGRPGDLR